METATKSEVASARRIAYSILVLGGPDLRSLSDDDLVAHIKQASKRVGAAIVASSVSTKDAAVAMTSMGKAMSASRALVRWP